MVFGEAHWRQKPATPRNLERLVQRGQHWLRGSNAHWDVDYAIYAHNLASGLCVLNDGERKWTISFSDPLLAPDTPL